MKIVVQNFKTGHLSVADMPPPTVRRGGVLVENTTSLISAGTDRAIIAMAKKNPLGKAQDRPDLAKQVLAKVRTEGFWNTYKMVNNLIAEPIPLGYSCAGRVIAVGEGVTGFGVGDRVACAGLGYANHAEVVFVPKNLAVKIPEGVGDEQAAYATLGAIALQGLRQAQLQMGSTVAVIGLGLVGLLTVQMAKASGFRVIGVDVDPAKNDLAVTLGADAACPPKSGELKAAVDRYTSGFGVDSVLVCAASKKSNETVVLAAELCRDRGSVVAVGDVNLDIPRREYFTKEIDVKLSRSYGPGRYDPAYEEQGHDYPIGYVRWTENRNMQAFLDQVAMGHFDPTALTTQDFPIERGEEAYQLVTDPPEGAFTVGIVLRYKADGSGRIARMDHAPKVRGQNAPVRLGVVGAGMFAKGILLPAFMAQKDVAMVGVATASGISAKSVAEKYGAAFSSSDAQEVIAHADVNTVLIATRHDTHGRYVLAALQAGKHVYVEKPPALNEEELAAIEQVWRGASADGGAPVLAVGYNRRFSPLAKTLKSAFGETHGPLSITYRVNAGRIDPKDKSGWVHDPGQGGGRVVGECGHFVDFCQYLIGSLPVKVMAMASGGEQPGALVDTLSIVIGYEDGSTATVHYFASGDKAFPKERVEVFGDGRVGVLDNFRSVQLSPGKRHRAMNQQKGFAEEAAAFVEGVRAGRLPIPMDVLLSTSRVTFAALRSLEEGGQVSV